MENNKTEQVDNVETPNVETKIKKKTVEPHLFKSPMETSVGNSIGFLAGNAPL